METFAATTIHEGLRFGEAPRWHDGRLWFSDFFRHGIFSVSPDGTDERREATLDTQPSGLGWLPDGTLLAVSMTDQRVLRGGDGPWRTHADIAEHCGFWANDMVVAANGVAYVGNFGFDLDLFLRDLHVEGANPPGPRDTNLVVIAADGTLAQVVADLSFPNGMVITPDGRTLVVAETMANRLSAFDVALDGTLSARRVFAELPGVAADGICLDAAGEVWVANAVSNECVRVREGGEITARATASQRVFAAMLGGEDRRTLYLMTAPDSSRFTVPAAAVGEGRIESARVDVPGAGRP
jgi:sugar lactone lactonase YvrE